MKIRIHLRTTQIKKQGHPLVISIYVNKSDSLYPFTGYYSTKEHWDFEKEEPKRSHPFFIQILNYILEVRLKINKILSSGKALSAVQVQNLLFGNAESLYYFWQQRIDEMISSGKKGNAGFYKIYLSAMKSYKSEINFEEIDYAFLVKFKNHKLKTCNANGVNVYIRAMRSIYNEAIRRGIHAPSSFVSPFNGVMEKAALTKDKNLSAEEMNLIYEAKWNHKYYDYFMLCFYLGGVDFIDIASIKKSQVKNNRIKFTRHKGGTNEVIDNMLCPEALEIFSRYESDSEYLMGMENYVYKFYRDRYVREFRKWKENLGITSYTDSKTPRYSFINIGKQLLLNRDVIMELTGHARGDVHSIYEGGFPNHIKDEIHQQIIDEIKKAVII